MARESWIDHKSHYQVTGDVDASGKMTDGEVTDNNGFTKDRNRTFESRAAFESYAQQSAGINW